VAVNDAVKASKRLSPGTFSPIKNRSDISRERFRKRIYTGDPGCRRKDVCMRSSNGPSTNCE
jgi:hypothetical protein